MVLFDQVRQWADDRNLLLGSTPQAQMLKTMEELGETAAAIARGNLEGVQDGIGDCVVCLTILAAQHGLTLEDCLATAWDAIKDRQGRMVDGIFIKEAA
jgi:NTP pyrophosphatase (non-canonical NTP hydrolase)